VAHFQTVRTDRTQPVLRLPLPALSDDMICPGFCGVAGLDSGDDAISFVGERNVMSFDECPQPARVCQFFCVNGLVGVCPLGLLGGVESVAVVDGQDV
jgi:hypothetical protein